MKKEKLSKDEKLMLMENTLRQIFVSSKNREVRRIINRVLNKVIT